MHKWVQQLLSKAVDILDSYISEVSESKKENNFLTPLSGRRKGKKGKSASKTMRQAVTAVFTVGSLVLACQSADFQSIIPLVHTIITSGNSEPRQRKLVGLTVSFREVAPTLYVQSWATMAKICLINDKLAKRYIPLFVQVLN